MKELQELIKKYKRELTFYTEIIEQNKSKTIEQIYMAHFEVRQIRAFISDLEMLKNIIHDL